MGNEFLPEMPQFRQPDGRTDWRQVADMFIPGNVWNSRTDEWRPRGMVAGAASTAFGPLGGALVEATEGLRMPNFNNTLGGLGNWISGRTGRGATMPDFSSSFGRIGNDAASTPTRNRDAINRQNSRVVRETRNAPASDINDFRRGTSPRLTRGGSAGGGNMGNVTLGLGQLGRGGDEAVMAASRTMHNRRGALMER